MEFVKLVGPFGVFFIMFALGLNLKIKRFLRVFSKPKNFISWNAMSNSCSSNNWFNNYKLFSYG